jgi:[acyl-carrier-protein] S-malonyltransferase
MQSAAEQFDEVLATLSWSTPSVPVIPNVDAVPTRDPYRLSALLRRQMLAPVRWAATSHALGQLALDAVVECGAIPALGPLIRQVHPSLPTYVLTSAEALPPSLASSAAFASTTTA